MPSRFEALTWDYSHEDLRYQIGVRLELFQLEAFSHYEAVRAVAVELFSSEEKSADAVVAQNETEAKSMLERMSRG